MGEKPQAAVDFFKRGWGDLLVGLAALVWALFAAVDWPSETLSALANALQQLCSWQVSGAFGLAAGTRGYKRLSGQSSD